MLVPAYLILIFFPLHLQIRRGEAGGLPTYHEYPNTIPLNVPTLAYPDAARRANGDSAPTAQGMQDPSLPSYDAAAPPKYEYATGAAAAAGAAGGAIQRAASSIRQALSRPGSIRRNDSSATTTTLQRRGEEPEMQEMTSTTTPAARVMTSAPVMHIAPPSNLSRNQSTTSVNTMRTARSNAGQEGIATPQDDGRMETISLEDERSTHRGE